MCLFFFKRKTAYEMRISDWSSDVCSSDLANARELLGRKRLEARHRHGCGGEPRLDACEQVVLPARPLELPAAERQQDRDRHQRAQGGADSRSETHGAPDSPAPGVPGPAADLGRTCAPTKKPMIARGRAI